ncbi:hypothetical protein IU427_01240 [Nocardia beijingensis]|uniref:hypothetical protein n=1 Tax=Nocardia beijingensis TaxID=95162 RepID=UPI001894A86E|nr:hypothetical protein [Nocardia beijingensis]MBF6463803.1 hypothetical protein [Nocardia beijingensis]
MSAWSQPITVCERSGSLDKHQVRSAGQSIVAGLRRFDFDLFPGWRALSENASSTRFRLSLLGYFAGAWTMKKVHDGGDGA